MLFPVGNGKEETLQGTASSVFKMKAKCSGAKAFLAQRESGNFLLKIPEKEVRIVSFRWSLEMTLPVSAVR